MISICVINRLTHLICVKLWSQIRITVWHLISSSKGLGLYEYCGGQAWLNLQKNDKHGWELERFILGSQV